MKVYLLHPGNAHYPEIDAYTACLVERGFDVASGHQDDFAKLADPGEWGLWCIMGFYRTLPGARFVVHDYRSLSVGRVAWMKDAVKRAWQARPQLRIFQNARMRDEMAFGDRVPSLLLPMGVPDWIFDIARDSAWTGPAGRFCYIGEMSRERGFDKVLSAYRAWRRSADDTLVLVGRAEAAILDRFRGVPGIRFVGCLPQRDALRVVLHSEYAVCYFPYHRPHCFQTPTKLLEYAALGKRIICNDAPSNLAVATSMGIRCQIAGRAIFDGCVVPAGDVAYNDPAGLHGIRWGSAIAASGVLDWIAEAFARDPRRPDPS